MPSYEYTSDYVTREPGSDRYKSADEMLNSYGEEGWQLVSVSVVPAALVTAVYEIFYFIRQKVGPTEGEKHD